MVACSLSANPADHVNGYDLRPPSLRQVGMKRFSLTLERITIVRSMVATPSSGWLFASSCPYRRGIAYYGEVGGKPPLPVRQF